MGWREFVWVGVSLCGLVSVFGFIGALVEKSLWWLMSGRVVMA